MALGRGRTCAALCASVAVACAGAASAQAAPDRLHVTAAPEIWPSFNPGITDYVSRCGSGRPLRLSVNAPPVGRVSVDGRRSRTGTFGARVPLSAGRATKLVLRREGRRRVYHVRCLPRSFPRWQFERFGRPQAQWYLFAPVAVPEPFVAQSRYVTLMSAHGVPVWWRREAFIPFNSILLPNGDLAWSRWNNRPFSQTDWERWEVHRLDGTLVRTLRAVGSPSDTHDMQPLPNGNYLLLTYRLRRGPVNTIDGEIQELTPDGKMVWSWNSGDHVDPSETDSFSAHTIRLPDGTLAYDVIHLNSVEPDGDGYVISARHAHAVYRIDRATGAVDWKLGGTQRPESLQVSGDPRSPTFLAQHDARLLSDGTLTVYDNRTGGGAPRAVRFSVDAQQGTARWLEDVSDPQAAHSNAQGSARRLAGGNWVVSWAGRTGVISEISAAGEPVFRLRLPGFDNYRITPVPFGTLPATRLRRAMNAMYPRGG